MAGRDGGGGTGSARRRRERRLCSMLRHERMAVAMALAESLHHSAQPLEKARAREVEEQDQHEALRRQEAPPPGKRPGVLQDPELQGRVERHCGVGYELVLAPDVPVLQMVEQSVGRFCAGFPRGGGGEGFGGGVSGTGPFRLPRLPGLGRAAAGGRSAEARAPPEGSWEEEEEEEEEEEASQVFLSSVSSCSRGSHSESLDTLLRTLPF